MLNIKLFGKVCSRELYDIAVPARGAAAVKFFTTGETMAAVASIPIGSSSCTRTRSRESLTLAPPATEIKPFSEIPGPKPLPIIRNLLDFKNNINRLIHFLEECHEKYGEIFKLEVPGEFLSEYKTRAIIVHNNFAVGLNRVSNYYIINMACARNFCSKTARKLRSDL